VRDLKRMEENTVVGFFNPDNYPRITRILHFLTETNQPDLSALFFLMICMAMQESPELQVLIDSKSVIRSWLKTQRYVTDRYTAEENLTNTVLAGWERSDDQMADGQEVVEIVRDAWDE